ncbi:hypothetical protein AMTRI_Chr02g263380 [Amborella trichopoda]
MAKIKYIYKHMTILKTDDGARPGERGGLLRGESRSFACNHRSNTVIPPPPRANHVREEGQPSSTVVVVSYQIRDATVQRQLIHTSITQTELCAVARPQWCELWPHGRLDARTRCTCMHRSNKLVDLKDELMKEIH